MAVTSLESIFWGVVGCWLLVVGCRLSVRLYYTTNNRLPTTHNQQPNTERKRKKAVCNIIAFRLQKLCFYMVITKLLQRNIYAFVFDCFLLVISLFNCLLCLYTQQVRYHQKLQKYIIKH